MRKTNAVDVVDDCAGEGLVEGNRWGENLPTAQVTVLRQAAGREKEQQQNRDKRHLHRRRSLEWLMVRVTSNPPERPTD